MRWVARGVAIAVLVLGWLFIALVNHFHFTAPLVFACIGHLAVVATIYNLWRTGAAAVDSTDDAGDSTWAKPAGALGELEREKRTLLKAIKEAEFDLQMGKLSQRDADEMIRGYRARAIDVIKEIDRLGLGTAGTVREQVMREVRARVQLEGKSPKTAGAKRGKPEKDAAAAPASDGKAARAKEAARGAAKDEAAKDAAAKGAATGEASSEVVSSTAVEVAKDPVTGDAATAGASSEVVQSKIAAAAEAAAQSGEAVAQSGEAAAQSGEAAAAEVPRDAGAAAVPAVVVPSDEDLDADSTTAIEPRSGKPAKEATR
jgi:hypothetical protein